MAKELTPEQTERLALVASVSTLGDMARIIRRDWPTPYFGAVPYLRALSDSDATIGDKRARYGADDMGSVVLYFLSNASTWRGPIAKAVKARLKKAYL